MREPHGRCGTSERTFTSPRAAPWHTESLRAVTATKGAFLRAKKVLDYEDTFLSKISWTAKTGFLENSRNVNLKLNIYLYKICKTALD